jgi:fatty acid desaturase
MALAFLPIAFVAGFTVGDPRRATGVSLVIWLAALAGLLAANLAGVAVSPWEALVLAVCLPPAVLLTRFAARLRQRSGSSAR